MYCVIFIFSFNFWCVFISHYSFLYSLCVWWAEWVFNFIAFIMEWFGFSICVWFSLCFPFSIMDFPQNLLFFPMVASSTGLWDVCILFMSLGGPCGGVMVWICLGGIIHGGEVLCFSIVTPAPYFYSSKVFFHAFIFYFLILVLFLFIPIFFFCFSISFSSVFPSLFFFIFSLFHSLFPSHIFFSFIHPSQLFSLLSTIHHYFPIILFILIFCNNFIFCFTFFFPIHANFYFPISSILFTPFPLPIHIFIYI